MSKKQFKAPSAEEVQQAYWETILAMKNRKLPAQQGKEVLNGILKLANHKIKRSIANQQLGTPSTPLLDMSLEKEVEEI
jgi:hypothetical protein